MIRIKFKQGDGIEGDWNDASVVPHIANSQVIAVTLKVTGKDGEAHFTFSDVLSWIKLPADTGAVKAIPTPAPKATAKGGALS